MIPFFWRLCDFFSSFLSLRSDYEESGLINSRTAVKLIEAEEARMEMKRKSPFQLEALEKFYAGIMSAAI